MVEPQDRTDADNHVDAHHTSAAAYDFITVGKNHVWFWRYEPDEPGGLVKKDPMYREKEGGGVRQDVYHGCFSRGWHCHFD